MEKRIRRNQTGIEIFNQIVFFFSFFTTTIFCVENADSLGHLEVLLSYTEYFLVYYREFFEEFVIL